MSEIPQFDPNKPHETVIAPPFDPNKPHEEVMGLGFDKPPGKGSLPPKEKPEANKLSWSEVPLRALSNAPSSAAGFVKNTVEPILHPMETVRNIGRAGRGALERAGVVEDKGYGKYADQVWEGLKARYGGEEQFKNTLATDPVGAIADLSMVLTGGETALARAPGFIGRVGEVAGAGARATNPINLAIRGAQVAAPAASQFLGNVAAGHGATAIGEAYETGRAGGVEGEAFRAGMRMPEGVQQGLVARFRDALNQIALERSAAYQRAMQQTGQIQTPLNFNDIHRALDEVQGVGRIGPYDVSRLAGERDLTPAQRMHAEIRQNIEAWERLNPQMFHTPAGFDALKKHVGDKIDWRSRPDAENRVARTVYHAIRDTIARQDPTYANTMRNYQQASDLIQELERTLSLGRGATQDTALRKILSATRSNVNTNFGRRTHLVRELNERDPTLLPLTAGVASSTWSPQGLIGRGLAGGGAGLAAYLHNPALLAALPATSPRLVSEAAHGAGRAVGAAANALPIAALPPGLRDFFRNNPQLLQRVLAASQQAGKANGQTSP